MFTSCFVPYIDSYIKFCGVVVTKFKIGATECRAWLFLGLDQSEPRIFCLTNESAVRRPVSPAMLVSIVPVAFLETRLVYGL